MRKFILILLFAAAAMAADNPVDRWANALGGREKLAAVRSTYQEATIEVGGLTGSIKVWATTDGKYRDEVKIATFSSIETFDGTSGSVQQGSAPPHKLAGADLERAKTRAYADANAVFFPERMPGRVTVEGDNVIVTKPEGGVESRITLDPETSLPKTMARRSGDRIVTLTFNSWETVDGVKFPKEIRQSTGDPRFDAVIRLDKLVMNAPVEASLFTIEPKQTASVVVWPEGKHEVTVPFELAQNHIYFPASVNGKPASQFVFDTGAEASAIDAGHAKALGLATKGKFEGRGAGPNSAEVSLIESPTISFGGISVPLQMLATIPLSSITLREGREMQGVVGYNVTSNFITDIDYAKRELRFHEPSSYTPNAGAVALPLSLLGEIPIVNVKVTMRDGRTFDARMLVDTGARNAVALNRPFIEKNDLARSIGPSFEGPLGLGIGGAVTQKVGRLKSIEIAGFTINDPITSFSTGTSAVESNPEIDGLIGGDILKRLTVTVDYPHERFLLQPNAALHDPFEYDMSGMMLEAGDATFRRAFVRNVLPNSPAAAAGVKVGDELQSVDGKSVESMKLDAVRAKFLQPGQKRTITLLRDGKRVKATLTTKRLV